MGQSIKQGQTIPETVTAIYPDSALSFKVPAETTLGDLATLISDWGEGHGGLPLYVDVTFRRAAATA